MVSAVIVAAGKGIRMNGAVRKQYLPLAGRPVLTHSLSVFETCQFIHRIVLVVPEDDLAYCQDHILSGFKERIELVAGGNNRQDSVYNGLIALGKNNGIVIIHDGVRPFLNREMLDSCVTGAKKHGACIIGVPVEHTLKKVNGIRNVEKTIERRNIWFAQTPQAFQYEIIRNAHEDARLKGYAGTDDAYLVEQMGNPVKMIKGDKNNIKITTREDLKLAQAILESGID
jgi:2-C-methyl-D-erythritol 4-phosphate cytidylyltransferase